MQNDQQNPFEAMTVYSMNEARAAEIQDRSDPVAGAYQTDALRHGIGNSTVSSNWWNRPEDERFLSLEDMLSFKQADARQMNDQIVNTHKMQIIGEIDEVEEAAAQEGIGKLFLIV